MEKMNVEKLFQLVILLIIVLVLSNEIYTMTSDNVPITLLIATLLIVIFGAIIINRKNDD